MEFKDLVGKTIISAVQVSPHEGYDDQGCLQLEFSDGTKASIVADYGGYTGDSYDEYPTCIYICDGWMVDN